MIVYVAGASSEIDTIESYLARLRAAGHQIAHDWCAMVRSVGSANAGMTGAERWKHARADRKAADECDVFWLIVPKAVSVGCWVEFGIAAAPRSNASLVIASGDDERSIFTTLADESFAAHEDAFAWIVQTGARSP